MGVRIVRNLRHPVAGYVPICLADIRRGSCGCAGRLRGDSRQRGPVHSGLRGVVAKRRRHRKCPT